MSKPFHKLVVASEYVLYARSKKEAEEKARALAQAAEPDADIDRVTARRFTGGADYGVNWSVEVEWSRP